MRHDLFQKGLKGRDYMAPGQTLVVGIARNSRHLSKRATMIIMLDGVPL